MPESTVYVNAYVREGRKDFPGTLVPRSPRCLALFWQGLVVLGPLRFAFFALRFFPVSVFVLLYHYWLALILTCSDFDLLRL